MTARLYSSRLSRFSRLLPPTSSIPAFAGLLLYGLQVASSNVKNVILMKSIRSVSYTEEGIPLASELYVRE
jgi:hypothetical protein